MEPGRQANKLRIFISYSRRDATAADALVDALQVRGFDVTIDQRDLPFGEKWQAELAEFIRLSDTVIWLVSEHSVRSEWVNWELDEVAKRNKRLVPVMVGETPRDKLPRQIGEIHILPAEGLLDISRDLDALVRVLDTDHGWLKEGTRLADHAHEWLTKGRASAQLLRGMALTAAEQWKDRRPVKAPAPAKEVLDLILASRQAATGRQRWWIGGSLFVTTGALALAGLAYTQSIKADHRRQETQKLREQTQITESGLLANAAGAAYGDGRDRARTTNAALLALAALPDSAIGVARPQVPEAEWQLNRAYRGLQELAQVDHYGSVQSAGFSPDGARIVTASSDGTARVWDWSSGRELAMLSHDGWVSAASFSPDGTRIVSIFNLPFAKGAKGEARLWDAANGRELARLRPDAHIMEASFSPDGARIVTVSSAHTAQIWDVASGRELARLDHDKSVNGAAFSADGARIVTASDDKTARLWDAVSGKELARLNHGEAVYVASFSPDGARIVTVSYKQTAQIWDVADGKEIARLSLDGGIDVPITRRRFYAAVFSHDGARIVTASIGKSAQIWDADSGKELARLSHDGLIYKVSLSPDGTHIVTASEDGTARFWNASTGQELARFGHDNRVLTAAFSSDGSRIVTASDDQTARVWDLTNRNEAMPLGHDSRVNAAAFSSDGARIVTAAGNLSHQGEARIWDAASGKELARLRHDGVVYAATFSRDGARIVTASFDETARVWDTASGKELTRLGPHGSIETALFSPDGRRVLTASRDTTARLWDAASGKELARLQHADIVWGASFSQDGTHIVTASQDKTARLWDAASGKELARLEHHANVLEAVFSPDVSADYLQIITVSGNYAYIWRAEQSADRLVQIAKHRVPRCLSSAQRAQYFLPAAPPLWCITGPGFETEKDAAKWQPKSPYRSPKWRRWLARQQAGTSKGWLGVRIGNLDGTNATSRGFASEKGILVAGNVPDGPAASSDLKQGDIILQLNGKTVENASEFAALIEALEPRSIARLHILRHGEERDVTVVLGESPGELPD